jgi:16S rRNA (adenine1518-N6/adenine1519-N6)-dimethyltransferase
MAPNQARQKSAMPPGDRGLRPRKSLGQNFLVDEAIRDMIIAAAQLKAHDLVIEVGPGQGALTEGLARAAGRVVALEVDDKLVNRLKRKLGKLDNLEIQHADVLRTDTASLVKDSGSFKVVANIPYYITSPILHHFAHGAVKPSLMVIMMQKEVADEVAAGPQRMSYLAVAMQLYYSAEIVCRVPRTSFYPVPRVDSAVVRFLLRPGEAAGVEDLACFLTVVHAGFAAPRKQLRNSLAIGLKTDAAGAIEVLRKGGIDPARRAETLSLAEWGDLYRAVIEGGEGRH